MAANVRRKVSSSATLFINDINPSVCINFQTEFSSLGPIVISQTAREAADDAKVVISIVPGAADVIKVYLDEKDGVVASKEDKERVMCECSTIDVKTTREVGEKVEERGRGWYVDTPVSGGVPAAQRGDLSVLIGAPDPTSDQSPLSDRLAGALSHIGSPQKFFYLQTLGAGLTAKISNNYLSGTILLATAEALAIGIRSGIDPQLLYQVIKNSTGQSWMCDHVHPVPGVVGHVPSSNGYRPGFKTQMMIKDLGLGIEAGREVGIEPVMAEAAMAVWEAASKNPVCYDRDGSSVYLHIGGPIPETKTESSE
ncbi:6-phosphogluconate dehydrogenase C-terminal domain-like protein [Delitschia confertaspora ATCC 74209]|uniref:3-hydroxyisobutyrate dehydrogenase n=1 Tax=Delitschia confertaspora ATCC 74209 TaxID=1513339 RepID=A0A9P4JID6_9PLEO|nr:6-phosphogluconate dehydrogenase C-terminal domain-like protein [Delitschia confertaspora ATCC 74209]